METSASASASSYPIGCHSGLNADDDPPRFTDLSRTGRALEAASALLSSKEATKALGQAVSDHLKLMQAQVRF